MKRFYRVFIKSLEPLQRFLFIRKRAVGLRFVGRAGDFADMRTWVIVEIRQDVAPADPTWPCGFSATASRGGHITDALRPISGNPTGSGGLTGMIGFDQANELRDIRRRKAQRETSNGSRRDIMAEARMREVIFDQRNHLIDDRGLDTDAFEKRARERTPGRLMTMRGPAEPAVAVAQSRRARRGEIMRQSRKQKHCAVVVIDHIARRDSRSRINHEHRMDADIALRMPFRILWDNQQALDLWEVNDPSRRRKVIRRYVRDAHSSQPTS